MPKHLSVHALIRWRSRPDRARIVQLLDKLTPDALAPTSLPWSDADTARTLRNVFDRTPWLGGFSLLYPPRRPGGAARAVGLRPQIGAGEISERGPKLDFFSLDGPWGFVSGSGIEHHSSDDAEWFLSKLVTILSCLDVETASANRTESVEAFLTRSHDPEAYTWPVMLAREPLQGWERHGLPDGRTLAYATRTPFGLSAQDLAKLTPAGARPSVPAW